MDHLTSHLPAPSADFYVQTALDATAEQQDGLPGCWKLVGGRALTLRARQAGRLRIAHGRIWITFKLAARDARVRAGDHFLGLGEALDLRAGESVVMESFSGNAAASAYFTWDPLPNANPLVFAGQSWRHNIYQPLADLRLALGLGAAALARLVRGLARGLTFGLVS